MSTAHQVPNELREAYLRFRSAAAAFIGIIEQVDAMHASAFLSRVRVAFVELYAVALSLPDVEPDTDSGLPDVDIPQELSIYNRIAEKLGDDGLVWESFDPTSGETPMRVPVAVHLSDAYGDVKRWLRAANTDVSIRDLMFDARLQFEIHWWRHAVSGIKALHHIIEHRFGERGSR